MHRFTLSISNPPFGFSAGCSDQGGRPVPGGIGLTLQVMPLKPLEPVSDVVIRFESASGSDVAWRELESSLTDALAQLRRLPEGEPARVDVLLKPSIFNRPAG